jgi:hypothetical protein
VLDLVEREAAKPCGAAQCHRRHVPPQSCYSFDLAAGAPLIVHSSCRRHCRRRHAKLLCLGGYESAAAKRWWRLHSGAVVFALAIARALVHSDGTGAKHHNATTAAAAPHYFALEAPPPAPAWRGLWRWSGVPRRWRQEQLL